MTTILVNHVYYSPIGHVVEAIQHAKRLHDANPGSNVYVALSDGAPWELCDGASWITGVYRVPLADPQSCDLSIPEMPREWDFVLDHNMTRYELECADLLAAQGRRPPGYVPGLGWEGEATEAYYKRTDTELFVRRGRGIIHPNLALPGGLGYEHRARFALTVPDAARGAARQYAHDGPRICILPAGSGPAAWWPRPESWIGMIDALRAGIPRSRFYLTGTRTAGRHRHRTTTSFDDAGLASILDSGDDVVDCYDIGLWNQVALLEACDLLVSPHSGFSFLALCVGTPWLTISGGNWPEYFSNGVPFYSVLPDNPDYPYLGALGYDYIGSTIRDMQPEQLWDRLSDLIEGAMFLLDPSTTYEDAIRQHLLNIARAPIRREQMP